LILLQEEASLTLPAVLQIISSKSVNKYLFRKGLNVI
jgi:hypothetical protein